MKKGLFIFALIAALGLLAGCQRNQTADDMTADTPGETIDDTESEDDIDLSGVVVDVGTYKGLEIEIQKIADVTDEDVDFQLQNIVSSAAPEVLVTDRAVAEGDLVSINYQGYENGTPVGTQESNYYLTIGSGVFFDGAEMNLIGRMGGETVDIPVTLPESYPDASLAGKSIVYQVTINGIIEIGSAELTDEYIQQISDCNTVEEYRAWLKKQMQDNIEYQRFMTIQDAVWNKLWEKTKITGYPEAARQKKLDYYKAFDQEAADHEGITLEEYVSSYFYITLEEYEQEIEHLVEQEIQTEVIVQTIAEQEGIKEVTDAEIEAYASQMGYDNIELLKQDFGEEDIKYRILLEKVTNLVIDAAVVTEVDTPVSSMNN